jgi:PadR family transcriptional regulator AphA
MSFRHFILGLLTQQPMSGYDIKLELQNLDWLVGNPSYGSLYPALHALEEDGLVTVEVESRRNRPSRKVYSITETGRAALNDWIKQPTGSNASMKTFVRRLILADNFSRVGLITQLHQRRAQVTAQRAALNDTHIGEYEDVGFGQQLALDYGMALAEAEVAWLDSTLDRLFEQSLPAEGAQGKGPSK